jgi:class 3 adenylate cyclase
METNGKDIRKEKSASMSADLERLLEERARLDDIIQNKFTRTITIMFTDMKGSSSIAEEEGDMVSRFLIKKHNDIVFPVINDKKGVLVKTMGDGTLSYFDSARDAVAAAVQMQININQFNHSRPTKTAIQIRIGLNTGSSIVEKNDIFGDVVNVASRFQTLALPGEIYISESTFNALEDKNEFYSRFVKETNLKGVRGIYKVFKIFWDREDIERDKALMASPIGGPGAVEHTIALKTLGAEKQSGEEENTALKKALDFEKSNELIELYLYSRQFKIKAIEDILRRLTGELENAGKTDTKFNGEEALWFFKDTITMGRVPESDFPLTNKAISRVPIKIGMKDGEGFLKIDSPAGEQIKPVELEKSFNKEALKPGVEYPLGKNGIIIFSECFPFEYKVYKDMFLVLRVLNPEECLQKQFNIKLKDVWKDFARESEKIVVIGK